MTDITAAEIDTPTEEVVDTSAAGQEAVTAEPEVPVLPIDDYADYRVPVKIDGEEQLVPLADAIGGYQRQADYTRKTQEVAQMREQLETAAALQQALEDNPAQTLAILQAIYKDADVEAAEAEMLDPQEARLRQLETWYEAEQQRATEAQVQAELDRIHAEHGVDQEELLRFAVDNGFPRLDWALASYQQTVQAAKSEIATQTAQADAQATASKQAAAFVAGGSSTNPSTVQAAAPSTASFGELARQIWRDAGYSV